MTKKLAIAMLLIATLAHGDEDRTRRAQRSGGVEPQNIIKSSEMLSDWWVDFADPATASLVDVGEVAAPKGGCWSQLWVATSTASTHGIYKDTTGDADFLMEEKVVYSAYVKNYSDYNYIKLSIYNPGTATHRTGSWSYSGGVWTEYGADPDIDGHTETSVGNGWWRLSVYVDAETRGIVGTQWNPYIFVTGDGSHADKGNYIYGVQGEYGRETPGPLKSTGEKVYPTRLVKRWRPNDFWYNYDFALDSGAYSSGSCPTGLEYVDDNPAFWWLGDGYMDMERVWGLGTDFTDVGIILSDIEVKANHYDLVDNVLKNTDDPIDGVDNDGDGIVDNYLGFDAFCMDGFPWWNSNEDDLTAVRIANGSRPVQHGSQMMSIMAARGNNEGWSYPPSITSKLQGSCGVLPFASIIPVKLKGVGVGSVDANKSNEAGDESGTAVSYSRYLYNITGVKSYVISMSYTGISKGTIYGLLNNDIYPVTGAGNSHKKYTTNIAYNDSMIVVGAVCKDNTTGWTSTASPGITDFGPGVTVCGYTGKEGYYYNWTEHKWVQLSPRTRPGSFTNGFTFAGHTAESLLWCSNFGAEGDYSEDELVDGIIPSPMFTSGATAQVAALVAAVKHFCPTASIKAIKPMIERGSITDIYDGTNDNMCQGGNCSNADWISWTFGRIVAPGDTVLVKDDGEYFIVDTSSGACSGDDSDLAGGSDPNNTYHSIGTSVSSANWKTVGMLGAGRINAYRTITLWGAISDTTITNATVYVSGDVQFTGNTSLTNVVFKIAPRDIYEEEIDLAWFSAQDQYEITGLTDVNPSPPTVPKVEIYFDGVFLTVNNCTFESNAAYPGDEDWGGIWLQTGTFAFGSGNVVNNTSLGNWP